MRQGHVLTVGLFALIALVMGCNSMQTSSAILRFQQGEFDMADSLCREALKVNPDDGEAYFYMALSQSMLDNYKDAYFNFKKAAELKPDRAEIAQANIESNFVKAYNSGVESAKGERAEDAIEYFTTATEADPENTLGYTNLAKAYWAKAENLKQLGTEYFIENGTLALENFEIGLSKDDDPERINATAQAMASVLGHLYVNADDKETREPYLTKYRNFTSELPDLYAPHESFASVLYDKAEDLKAARRQMERFKDFYIYAGEGYAKAADLRKSIGEDLVDIPLFAGIAYLNAEMFEESARYLDSAVKMDPNLDQAWFFLQYCRFQTKNYDECIKAGKFQDETLGSTDPQVFQLIWQSYREKAIAADLAGDSEGWIEFKRFYEDFYIKYATYKASGDTTPPPLLSQKEQEEQDRKDNALFTEGDVAVIEASIRGKFIRGIILNKGEESLEYIEIHIDLLDTDGEVITSTMAEVEDLEAGVEVQFDAAFIDEDVDDFEITELIAE